MPEVVYHSEYDIYTKRYLEESNELLLSDVYRVNIV